MKTFEVEKMACDLCCSDIGKVLYRIDVPGSHSSVYVCEYCIRAVAEFAIKNGLIKLGNGGEKNDNADS